MGHPIEPAGLRDLTLDTSESELLAPWIDQFNTASQNATTLLNTFAEAPFVGEQQALVNFSDYAQELLDDPTNSNTVAQQLQSDLDVLLQGYGLQNATHDTVKAVTEYTLSPLVNPTPTNPIEDFGHYGLLGAIPQYLPSNVDPAEVTSIINFLASPASGIIMGDLGPFISPWVALFNSIDAGDDFNETLANMVGAFFNGADLNLDALLPAINSADVFPAGMSMDELDIAFRGLLSPGAVAAGPDAVGGSIFNSVGVDFNGVPIVQTLHVVSQPVGPIAAWEGWEQAMATVLGWDGSGSPLADVTLPIIPTDDGGASAAATDLAGWLQDLFAAF